MFIYDYHYSRAMTEDRLRKARLHRQITLAKRARTGETLSRRIGLKLGGWGLGLLAALDDRRHPIAVPATAPAERAACACQA